MFQCMAPKANAGAVALLERDDARCVVAAEAVAHDGNPFRVRLCARRNPVVGCRARHFVVVARADVAQPQRLALARAVDRERMPAARRELEAVEEHAHLLAVVEAVEGDHHRRAPLNARRLHEKRGQRPALVRHLDPLDVRMAAEDAFRLALDRPAAHLAFFRAGNDEALGDEVIHAGAQKEIGRAHAVFLGGLRRFFQSDR
jgi:hypothetical protein